jgi:ABC-2 type transport system permease protein
MRLYYELAKRSLRRQTAYRAANWAGFATNSFFGCLRSYVFIALFAGQTVAAGYDLLDSLRYTWLTQGLLAFTFIWGWWDLAESIRSGQIASDLAKPFDYYAFWLSQDLGRALYHLLFRAIPTYAVGMILFHTTLPGDALTWVGFLASLTCAALVSFSFRFLVNLSAFWTLDSRGVAMVANIFTTFFSGLLLPIAFFPDWLRQIAEVLPFQAMIYVPTAVFLGKVTGAALLLSLGQQALWFVLLALLGRALLGLATRRLVVQGG